MDHCSGVILLNDAASFRDGNRTTSNQFWTEISVCVCVCSQDGLVNAFVTEAVTRLKITASFIYSLMPNMTSNE